MKLFSSVICMLLLVGCQLTPVVEKTILFNGKDLTNWKISNFGGEGEVTIEVHTDDYGYECYWEIVPSGNACGVGTIASGGNLTIGCNGGGAQAQDPGGYGNNLDITEGPWCLPLGNSYDLIFVDDWGDGGIGFDIFVNGFQIETFDGMALGGTFTFTVADPPAYDLSVFGSNIYNYVSTGAFDIQARVFNGGLTTVTSYDINYSIDGGTAVTHSVTTNMINFADETAYHSIPLNIPTNGVYTIDIWADNINGGMVDLVPSNDVFTVQVEAGPGHEGVCGRQTGGGGDGKWDRIGKYQTKREEEKGSNVPGAWI